MTNVYDRIGEGYLKHRCADRRIVKEVARLVGLCIKAPQIGDTDS